MVESIVVWRPWNVSSWCSELWCVEGVAGRGHERLRQMQGEVLKPHILLWERCLVRHRLRVSHEFVPVGVLQEPILRVENKCFFFHGNEVRCGFLRLLKSGDGVTGFCWQAVWSVQIEQVAVGRPAGVDPEGVVEYVERLQLKRGGTGRTGIVCSWY